MRTVPTARIQDCVAALARKANLVLRPDLVRALSRARARDRDPAVRRVWDILIENARLARARGLALCQDTGLPCVFVSVGQQVRLMGAPISLAIARGIERGYREASLRPSIVRDPLVREGSHFSPPLISYDIVPGDRVSVTVFPKGFGCENKSRLIMLHPTATDRQIESAVVGTVADAGADACPPYVIGVGIGGTQDKAGFLAKKALVRSIERAHRRRRVALLEKRLCTACNALGIGPMGLGGKTTVLGVNVETAATHIAGMPVAVNVSCHALRSAHAVI